MQASKVALDNTRDQVLACVDIAKRAGLDFLVLNQTRPDIGNAGGQGDRAGLYGISTPASRRAGLYDVPVKLGHRT